MYFQDICIRFLCVFYLTLKDQDGSEFWLIGVVDIKKKEIGCGK